MFSRFLGKESKSEVKSQEPAREVVAIPRGLEVIEDDPETVWGLWDSALADQESRFQTLPADAMLPADAIPVGSKRFQDGFGVDEFETPTRPIPLEELSLDQRKENAMQVVELYHKRIANTINTLWGYKECSVYINKLIMNGGDGMGHARIGFNQDAVNAMMSLVDIHDQQFGPPNTGGLDALSLM